MKTTRLALVLLLAAAASGLHAQTVLTRRVINDGKGIDYDPQIVLSEGGNYAVIWGRDVKNDKAVIYGRLVGTDGATKGSQRSNLLGAHHYRWTSFATGHRPTGGFLLAGSDWQSGSLATRPFDQKLRAQGPATTSLGFGFDPAMTAGGYGFVISWVGPASTCYAQMIDTRGQAASDRITITAADKKSFFDPRRVVATPSGDYLVAGVETKSDYSAARAGGATVRSGFDPSAKVFAYDTSFFSEDNGVDAAFDGKAGVVFYHHQKSSAEIAAFRRSLKSDGKPSGAGKKFPAGGSKWTSSYRVVPLTGTDSFVVSWDDPNAGHVYLQKINSSGTPLGTPLAVTENAYRHPTGVTDMVWDAESQRLLAVWTEYVSETSHNTHVYLGTISIPTD